MYHFVLKGNNFEMENTKIMNFCRTGAGNRDIQT